MSTFFTFSYSIFGLIIAIERLSMFLNWYFFFIFISNKEPNDPLHYFLGLYSAYHIFFCLYFFYFEGYFDVNSDSNFVSGDNNASTIFEPDTQNNVIPHDQSKTTEKPMYIPEKIVLGSWIFFTIFIFVIANTLK